MRTKPFFKIIFLVFIVLDLCYSFVQHYNEPFDGDMANIILPSKNYSHVLKDPFGWSILREGKRYTGSNRYFIHKSMSVYFKAAPKYIQNFTSPINSIYLSAAIFKIILQVLLLWILMVYISGSGNILNEQSLIAALIITPLFQHTLFNHSIGIISDSITYTFFYGFPIAVLLLFFLPFFQALTSDKKIEDMLNPIYQIWLISLILFLAFSGPLIAPSVLIICSLTLLVFFYKHFKSSFPKSLFPRIMAAIKGIPFPFLSFFLFFILTCLYSFYIGTFNVENNESVNLLERYELLFMGLLKQLTTRFAFPLLILMILLNTFLITREKKNATQQLLLNTLKYIVIFSFIYILLLPLGGYREYRPFIVRGDTLMPVMIGLFYFYGKTTLYLSFNMKLQLKKYYLLGVFIFSLVLMIGDEPNFGKNDCERSALNDLVHSTKKITQLPNDCTILNWSLAHETYQSHLNARLLQQWGITSDLKLYYQERD